MLDLSPTLTVSVVPFQSPNPHCRSRFLAFLENSPVGAQGAGETETDALIDLAELLIDTDQPHEHITATMVRAAALGSKALSDLIDTVNGLDIGAELPSDVYAEPLAQLQIIDPVAAHARRMW
ncbi:hypothetical protein [Epibacterium ulvae]|uniref:hypothetical protein n=1 Tax=Epibacterium ulvae TaxID=1156985 RepID=UPI0024915218|nr:hypothetical protein [Epibacterium ulvae]